MKTCPDTECEEIVHVDRRRGRGVISNRSGRFETECVETIDDGWDGAGALAPLKTTVQLEKSRTIISRNSSPDVPFSQSINAYRGCEHGCSYCYARPTHCFLGHSAGLDFETKLYAKPDAAGLLERELANPRYRAQTIVLGTNTDPYQPIERHHKLTRSLLEVMDKTSHPVGIVTKSALVTRDIDLLGALANRGLVKVVLSVTTLDRRLARKMEPRAATPAKRIDALQQLHDAGVPTGILAAPMIPALNDPELEAILKMGADAGATEAGYVTLRLPLEIKDLFHEWLMEAYPDKAEHVMMLVRSMHDGKAYNAEFYRRGRGSGPYAQMLAKRFQVALRRLKLNEREMTLRTDLFQAPVLKGGQLRLI